jgi:hypothetical protein
MDSQSAFQLTFDFGTSKPIVVEPSAAQVSSDGGLLAFRQLDERLGLTRQFAEALRDRRAGGYVEHTLLEMTRMRVYGILADYADQNDHDVLRRDPIFKLLCNRSIHAPDLASQPTLSRFENAIDVPSFFRLQDLLLEQFLASFHEPPTQLTLDIDCFDDPTHGAQQLTFFHGYYDQYQYLPRVITCAENDLVLNLCLLYGSAHPALGAADDLESLVRRLRQLWPDVHLHLRADTGFAVPALYETCERLGVFYTIGLGMNPRLKKQSENLLQEAVERFEQTGQAQRLFEGFWYQADSWPRARWVVLKCEANAQGTNRRAVVTNRPGAAVLPEAAYDAYTQRGESENRNKELKSGLRADRLSDHRYFANLFRLYLHTLAYHLLVRLRQLVLDAPPPEPPPEVPAEALEGPAESLPGSSPSPTPSEVPVEALQGPARRRYHNRRRAHDPLGEGQPCTWRTRLIKVAACVFESTRRVVVQLSSSWPYLKHYEHVSQQVLALGTLGLDTS